MEFYLKDLHELTNKCNSLKQQLKDCQNNHADMVKRNAALRDRPDLPPERVAAVQVLVDDNEKLTQQLASSKDECERLKKELAKPNDALSFEF